MIKIVIVDDHEVVREGLKAVLQREADFDVVAEAASAEGLGELVDHFRPDVVLLDARLPGVSGAEACRRLGATHPGVAVLIVSTFSDDGLVEECIRSGAWGYVTKDIERFNLAESIRAVHGGGGPLSPVMAAKLFARLRAQGDGSRHGASSTRHAAVAGDLPRRP